MSLNLRALVFICPALLPPPDPSDRDFYEILGLQPSASVDDIRKAYRKLSLQLHPDKVAQRRQGNIEEAAQEYEQVQHAHSVLVDPEQRQMYHSLGRSPTRHRFVATGSLTNPLALYENLAKASCLDKSRLVIICALILCMFLIQPILVAVKVNAIAKDQACRNLFNSPSCASENSLMDVAWMIIFLPTWILLGLIILAWSGLLLFAPAEARRKVVLTILELLSWLVGLLVAAWAWENHNEDKNWHFISMPFYFALIFRIIGATTGARQLQGEISRMVSPDYLRSKEGDSISEERLAQLADEYVIVTVNELAVAATVQVLSADPESPPLTDEDIEAIRVDSSPEYETNAQLIRLFYGSVGKTVLIVIPFVALVACRVEDNIKASWWVVFIPIWVYFASQLLSSCSTICCTIVPDEEDMVMAPMAPNLEEVDRESENKETPDEQDEPVINPFVQSPKKASHHKSSEVEEKSEPLSPRPKRSSFVSPEGAMMEDVHLDEQKSPKKKKKKKKSKKKSREENGTTQKVDEDASSKLDPEEQNAKPGKRKKSSKKRVSGRPTRDEENPVEPSSSRDEENPVEPSSSRDEENPTEPSNSRDETTTETNGGTTANGNSNEDFELDGEDGPPLDEEFYRAWQSAYQQEEEGAMERQAKAQATICTVCFQIVVTLLIVGKLSQDYENHGDSAGYNAMLILIPVFLIASLLLCCCSCLIYGAGAEGLDSLVEKAKAPETGEEAGETASGDATSPPFAAPQPVSQSPDLKEQEGANVNIVEPAQPEAHMEGSESMNDLD